MNRTAIRYQNFAKQRHQPVARVSRRLNHSDQALLPFDQPAGIGQCLAGQAQPVEPAVFAGYVIENALQAFDAAAQARVPLLLGSTVEVRDWNGFQVNAF